TSVPRAPLPPPAPRYRGALLLLLVAILALTACAIGASSTTPRATGAPISTGTPATGTPLPSGFQAGDWPLFGYDPARGSGNLHETTLTPAAVGRLHRLWQVRLPGVADSSPALLASLTLPNGTTGDVLFVTTRDGRLLALNASTGAQLWSRRPSGPH